MAEVQKTGNEAQFSEEYRSKVLVKLKEKADSLGLNFNPDIFTVTLLPKREVAIVNYITRSPRYNHFGESVDERISNLHEFLDSKELKSVGTGGSADISKERIDQTLAKVNNPADKELLASILGKLRYNHEGNACVVGIEDTPNETAGIVLHEWVHQLLNSNKLGFYDTGGERQSYNESLTIFVEYYQGHYNNGMDTEKLWAEYLKKHEADTKNAHFWNSIKHFGEIKALVDNNNTPTSRREALFNYFKNLPIPDKYKFH